MVRRHASTVTSYTAEFTRLATMLGWDDASLMLIFYQGLRDDIKDERARSERLDSLQVLILLIVRIDLRFSLRRMSGNTIR